TQRPEALLERLRTWEFIDAAAPEADDHTTLADAFNAGDDAEEIDFSAFDLAAEDTAAEDTAAGTEVIPADDWAADELTLEAEPAAVPDWLSDDNAAPEAEELTAEDALAEDVLADDVLAEDVLAEDVLAEDITLAESPAAADDDSIDDEILEIFLEEAQEIGESVETALLRWRENPDDLLQVAQLQRELHTLKGGARMAEIAAVADLCHELETLYENVSDGRLSTEPALFELLDRAHDELGVQLDAVRSGQVPEPADAMMAEIRGFLRGQAYAEVPDYVDDESATETVPAVSAAIHTETLDESDREILEIFLEEAHELQEALDRALHDWEQEPDERAGPEEAQRV